LSQEPSSVTPQTLRVENLGRTSFGDALEMQTRCLRQRRSGLCADTLLLTEHGPVVTIGRATDPDEAEDTAELAARGIEVHQVSRGGKVTYHGPGQLMGYLIADLRPQGRDLHRFMESLQAALIAALRALDVDARAREGLRGVWVDDRKIASIGVAVRGWVTYHGFALNVRGDLGPFDLIRPCGLEGVAMTSIEAELGRTPEWNQVQAVVVEAVVRQYGYAGVEGPA